YTVRNSSAASDVYKRQREAMRRFADWVREGLAAGERPVFVGHNAVFDWAYINYYFHHFEMDNVFGYKAIDQKSLAMGVLRIPWWDAQKDILVQKLPGLSGLKEGERAHDALDDARFQARILCALLDHRG
ncbi:MAG: 3'-5' exoribonuclease, partial [Candidatus Eisenbacteria bacterium]|nr:3'-5' exoribonuclease [Candidatus Eisenbacteria bacterium]